MKLNTIMASLALLLALAFNPLKSQNMGKDYQTALGIKFFPGAISLKHFIQKDRALEGLGYFWAHGFRFTGLYELHFDIPGVDNLRWYVGPGAHVGRFNSFYQNKFPGRSGWLEMGIDGVIGLDYKLEGAPLNFSIDWQPSLTLVNYTGFNFGWGGLAIRYTF